ncbi:MAG: cellulase family glycosylhydrolase [Ktedonobacteraceae bacterium]
MKVASLAAGLGTAYLAGCGDGGGQPRKNAGLLTQTPENGFPSGLPQSIVPDGLGVNVQFTATDTSAIVTKIADAGFRFARLDMLWNLVEQARGHYDFSIYEPIVGALAARGIRPLFILDYNNPLYDNTHSPPLTEVGPQTDQVRQAFARFAAVAAEHFKADSVVWEIWNEPDNPRFWYPKPDPDSYMTLAKAAIGAMRQADPQATIVGPALVGLEPKYQDAWNFLQRCFVLGLPTLVDAISVHSYRLGAPESATPDYQRLRTLLTRYAPPEKTNLPIICSEWGYSLTWVSEQQQAEYFARLYLINLLNNLPLTIWYNWHDGPDPKQIEDNFGLVTYTDQPKIVYSAAQTLTHELTNFRFAERISLPSNADYALLFTNGPARKRVVWTTDSSHTVALPMNGTSVTVTNLTGETRTLPIINGQLTLELSGSPQYVKIQ